MVPNLLQTELHVLQILHQTELQVVPNLPQTELKLRQLMRHLSSETVYILIPKIYKHEKSKASSL